MSENIKNRYIAYEYKEVKVESNMVSMYLEGYESFGWIKDDIKKDIGKNNKKILRIKRERKIINKAELTRLQRHFENCMQQLKSLEKAKTNKALITSLGIGIVGTIFMAASVLAVTHNPPIIWLCILFAIPAFIGWIVPYFLYKKIASKKTKEINPLIEEKLDEVYEICKKGYKILM